MPEAFETCVKSGGRVRTKRLGKGKYMHICFKGGKSYAGEVKTKQMEKTGTDKNEFSEGLRG
jgi:hypothetical protein